MRRISWFFLATLSVGCADRTTGGDGSGSGGSGGTGATSTSDTTTTTTSTTGGSTGDTAGDTVGPGCDAHANEPPGSFLFTIRNNRDEAIVLGGPTSCQPSLISVESEAGGWFGPHCAITCEDAMVGACGCTDDCPAAPAIRIEPGGTYLVDWHGLVMSPTELTPECADENCGTSCNTLLQVQQGVVHQVTIGLVDPDMCIAGGCDCTANSDGWCMVDGYYDQTMPLSSGFTYQQGGAADIVVG